MNYDSIALWSQVVAAFAFAAIIVWAYVKFLIPGLQAATEAKREEILARERRRDEALKAVEAARAKVTEAEIAAAGIRERAIEDASRRSERILGEAWRESERTIHGAGQELERARLAASDKLRVELIEKALQRAQAVARERIDAQRDAQLVESFITDLERGYQR